MQGYTVKAVGRVFKAKVTCSRENVSHLLEQAEAFTELVGHHLEAIPLYGVTRDALHSALYQPLREYMPTVNSLLIQAARDEALEKVEACIARIHAGYYHGRYPGVHKPLWALRLVGGNQRGGGTLHLNAGDLTHATILGQWVTLAFRSEDVLLLTGRLEAERKTKDQHLGKKGKRSNLLKQGVIKVKAAGLAHLLLPESENGDAYLHIAVQRRVELPNPWWLRKHSGRLVVVSVDLGIMNLAVVTVMNKEGRILELPTFIAGGEWLHPLSRYGGDIRDAQRHHRKLHSLRSKRRLLNREYSHRVSRRIVDIAWAWKERGYHVVIVMEDLGRMRIDNEPRPRWLNRKLALWMRSQIRRYVKYKTNWVGIPVQSINPRLTSQTCPHCKARGIRNRAWFRCSECRYKANADFVGAWNIGLRFLGLLHRPKKAATRKYRTASRKGGIPTGKIVLQPKRRTVGPEQSEQLHTRPPADIADERDAPEGVIPHVYHEGGVKGIQADGRTEEASESFPRSFTHGFTT